MEAEFFDSLYEGDSPNGVRLGMGLTGGDFWPRITGCQVLYRGVSLDKIDFSNILAVTEVEASEIWPPSYVPHNSNSTYYYVVRRVNNCGCQEHTLAAAVKVSIDAGGNLAEPQPNNIFEARAKQVDANKVQLVWYYCPVKQQSPPACFKVYYDAGTGQINYENTIATICYAGLRFYSYQSDTLEASKYLFCIRAEDAAGAANASLAEMRIQLDTASPGAVNILSAETI
ncbi:MAG: hypothetical protein AMJ75_02110 [Phycisphaerae bacterium SM1_79]|nr:MAG: hypothetical protein AMJ75_02110 [Phycisphaerae bacterium SM1_79]